MMLTTASTTDVALPGQQNIRYAPGYADVTHRDAHNSHHNSHAFAHEQRNQTDTQSCLSHKERRLFQISNAL
jgi:hypothetical protein